MKIRDIAEKILDKKVFTIEELTDEFYATWRGILPRSIIKKRIIEFLQKQLQTGFVRKVYTNGHNYTIFAIKDATEEDIKDYLPVCKICGRKFYPKQHDQKICKSVKCQREYVRRFKRIKKRLDPEKYRNWTKEEEALILETFPDFRFCLKKAEELSKKIGRAPTAIKKRLYQLKKKEG